MNIKKTMSELERIDSTEFKKIKKIAVNIVLDNVRSAHNVGSIFRTADAFLIKKIYLTGITPTPPHKEIRKTALGSTETIEWEYVNEIVPFLKKITGNKKVIGVEQAKKSCSLSDIKIDTEAEYYLIFGNEVDGVQESVLEICTEFLEIPQSGTKHSLNVATSSGIVLWEFFKKLK